MTCSLSFCPWLQCLYGFIICLKAVDITSCWMTSHHLVAEGRYHVLLGLDIPRKVEQTADLGVWQGKLERVGLHLEHCIHFLEPCWRGKWPGAGQPAFLSPFPSLENWTLTATFGALGSPNKVMRTEMEHSRAGAAAWWLSSCGQKGPAPHNQSVSQASKHSKILRYLSSW